MVDLDLQCVGSGFLDGGLIGDLIFMAKRIEIGIQIGQRFGARVNEETAPSTGGNLLQGFGGIFTAVSGWADQPDKQTGIGLSRCRGLFLQTSELGFIGQRSDVENDPGFMIGSGQAFHQSSGLRQTIY